jgi:hypothetical protein
VQGSGRRGGCLTQARVGLRRWAWAPVAAETPQTVTAALDPAAPAVDGPVLAPYGPAPFDIADGGTWAIAPWAPPWN